MTNPADNFYCFTDEMWNEARGEPVKKSAPRLRAEEEAEEAELRKDGYRIQPCVCCGRMTERRWCSDSCFYMEDGGGDPEGYR